MRESPDAIDAYLAEVRGYYDDALDDYVRVYGDTFQVALVAGEEGAEGGGSPSAVSNVALAREAGVRPGDRVLDAGCGVCGPAVDVARAFDGVRVAGVTLSPRQAAAAGARIEREGLEARVRVHVGDYHALPFGDGAFDVALFLESACYAHDRPRLFREAFRVLRPGGWLLVKDVFRRAGEFDPRVVEQFDRFNRLYRARIAPVADFTRAIRSAGFRDVQVEPLAGRMALRTYLAADAGAEGENLPAPRGAVRLMAEMASIRARRPD
jgi:SAM-dependent methyltransferase